MSGTSKRSVTSIARKRPIEGDSARFPSERLVRTVVAAVLCRQAVCGDGADGGDDVGYVRACGVLGGLGIARAQRGEDRFVLGERLRGAARFEHRTELVAHALRLQERQEARRGVVAGELEDRAVKTRVELRVPEQIGGVLPTRISATIVSSAAIPPSSIRCAARRATSPSRTERVSRTRPPRRG